MNEFVESWSQLDVCCSDCAHTFTTGDHYMICPDCGAYFCEECAVDGEVPTHNCEEDYNGID